MKVEKLLNRSPDFWHIEPKSTHEDPLLDCLIAIAQLHGTPATAQTLLAGLPLVEQRLTPTLLPRAAARAKLSARLVKSALTDIPTNILPVILLLHDGRACLLLEKHPQKYLISHPQLGNSVMEIEAKELAQDYFGVACYVRPQFKFDARTTGSNTKRQRHWFWSTVFESHRFYRDAVLATLLINLFALAMPLFTMNVYDRVVPNNAIETLWVFVAGISMTIIFNTLLNVARAHVIDCASKRIDVTLSSRIMERILDLRVDSRPNSAGAFAANVRSFEVIRDFIASASLTTLVDLPFALLFLMILGWISPWMVMPALIAMMISLVVSLIAQYRMQSLTLKAFQACAQRNATLVETLTGLETIKALNAQAAIQRRWEHVTAYIAQVNSKLKIISSATVSIVCALQQLVAIAVIIIGVYLAKNSTLSLGGIIAASMIASRCLAPLGHFAALLMQYQNARASLGAIDHTMRLPVERPPHTTFLHRPAIQGAIEFRDVSFSYPGAAQPVLKHLSFKLRPGEKVAIVGRMGSGKTTLEKLVLGFYPPTTGTVLVDGIAVQQFDPCDLRRAIGYVPQDPILFYGSLKHNITLGVPFVDDTAIVAAADTAGVSEFTNLHPAGFDQIVHERGESLSGGQRQAVAIARALIHDPPILLFDEPSSNMDNQSEARLARRLAIAAGQKTLLLVTHRTTLLELVSRVIVIEAGKIVADGPKKEVIATLRGRCNKPEMPP